MFCRALPLPGQGALNTREIGHSSSLHTAASGTFELSLQSALHRSIALLVLYRSCAGIQPHEGYTSLFELQFQATLLDGETRHTTNKRKDVPDKHDYRSVTFI